MALTVVLTQIEKRLARLPAVASERAEALALYHELAKNTAWANEAVTQLALTQTQGSKTLGPGRVVLLRDGHFDLDAGVVVKMAAPGVLLVLGAVTQHRKSGELGELGSEASHATTS